MSLHKNNITAGQGRWLSKQEDLTANPQGPCKKLGTTIGACDSGIMGWRQLDAGSSLPNKPGPNSKILVQEENLSQGNEDSGREKHQSLPLHIYMYATRPHPHINQSCNTLRIINIQMGTCVYLINFLVYLKLIK